MSQLAERRTLNHLIEICRDAERGFRFAAGHVTDPSAKSLFENIALQRARFAEALVPHAHGLDGPSEAGGTTAGAVHRTWMALKDRLTAHDEKAIIAEAERGEHAAIAAYREALGNSLPPAARDLIENQCAAVLRSLDQVRRLM